MKKKIIIGISAAGIVIAAIIVGIVIGNLSKKKNNDDINVTCKAEITKDGDITCYEWLKKLCEKTAIDADDYRKAAKEYGYITDNDEFNNDDIASGEFIALSAMRAMGENKMQIYLGTDEDITDRTNRELALDKELISEDSLNKGFSDEEAEKVLDKFDDLYYGEFWPNNIENIIYNDNVKQLKYFDIKDYKEDENTIQLDTDAVKDLKKGDTLVFDYNGMKVSKKIKEVGVNGIFSLESPVMEDVFDTLTISDSTSLTLDDIINYYGLNNVDTSSRKNTTVMTANVSGNIKSNGFKIGVSKNNDNELEVELEDNNTGASYKLPVKHKLKNNCDNFSVQWDVKNIGVGAQVKYNLKDGLKYASVGVDIDSEISSSIEGELSEGILLCQTPKPIGNAAVSVNVALYIVPDVDGKLTLKVEVPFHSGISYEKGKGTKTTMGLKSSMQTSIEAEGSMGLYFRTAPMLVTMKTIPLVDAELDMGAVAKGTRTGRNNGQICSDVSIQFPIFKISTGSDDVKFNNKKSLFSEIGISIEKSFDKFAKTASTHYEQLPDGTKQFVKECTYSEQTESEKAKDGETATEAEVPTQGQSGQETNVKKSDSLNTYKTRLAEYYPEQTTFYFDYPDNWTMTTEKLNSSSEYIVLENENGVRLFFDARPNKAPNSANGGGKQYVSASVTKIAKSQYNPDENFWIVKIKDKELTDGLSGQTITYDDGPEMYAIMPEEKAAKNSISYVGTGIEMWCMFDCPNAAGFMTQANAKLTDKDREEIIAILQSFRDTP